MLGDNTTAESGRLSQNVSHLNVYKNLIFANYNVSNYWAASLTHRDAFGMGDLESNPLQSSTPDRSRSSKKRSASSSPQRPFGATERQLKYLSNKLESVRKELKLKVNILSKMYRGQVFLVKKRDPIRKDNFDKYY